MSSQTQKALFLESLKTPLVIKERDIPRPGKDQVLVRIHTAALNPIDFKIQLRGLFIEKFPAILGVDLAGVVADVGEGVQKFAKGDRVFAHGHFTNDQAAFQEYTLAHADYTAKVPPNLDFDYAATVPLGFDTAAIGLYSEQIGAGLRSPWEEGGQGKYSGKPILILGGSASVGQYVIQLARLSGFSPVITTASLANREQLEALGATDVVDRHLAEDELKAVLQNITKQPIEIIYDAISLPETQQTAWSVLAPGGKLILTLAPTVKEEEGKNRSAIATYGSPFAPSNGALSRASWGVLGKWLEEGAIKPNRFEVLPNGLGGVEAGLRRLESGKVSGTKLVVHVQETT